MHSRIHLVVAALALALATSCHDSTPPKCGTLDVSVATPAGGEPVISWTPRSCPVTDLQVWDANQSPVWHVYVLLADTLISPDVTYGVTPPSAHVTVQPATLVAGRTYTVDLLWEGAAVTYGGSTTFTR